MTNSREKGKRFERTVARHFRVLFPDASREGWKQARAGDEAEDVSAGPFAIEAKHRARQDVWAAVAQAGKNAGGKLPIAVLRRGRNEPNIVAMELDVFFHILKGGLDDDFKGGDTGGGDEVPGAGAPAEDGEAKAQD